MKKLRLKLWQSWHLHSWNSTPEATLSLYFYNSNSWTSYENRCYETAVIWHYLHYTFHQKRSKVIIDLNMKTLRQAKQHKKIEKEKLTAQTLPLSKTWIPGGGLSASPSGYLFSPHNRCNPRPPQASFPTRFHTGGLHILLPPFTLLTNSTMAPTAVHPSPAKFSDADTSLKRWRKWNWSRPFP